MNPSAWSYYIFDLYGTLIDIHTDEEQPELWEKTAAYIKEHFDTITTGAKLRKDYLRICAEEEQKLAAINKSQYPEIQIEDVWKRLIKAPCTAEQMRSLCVMFRTASRDKLVRYPGVREVFENIKQAGGKIFLLSNAQRAFTEKELQDTGLTEYFDDIFISSDQGIKKPDGDFLRRLMEKHDLEPEKCVMIGNEVSSDVAVAAQVGIDAIYLNTYSRTIKEMQRALKLCHANPERVKIVMDGDIRKAGII